MTEFSQDVRVILAGLTGVPIREDDAALDFPVDSRGAPSPYVQFAYVAAPSRAFALRGGGTVVRRGFLQVDLYVPERTGRPAARTLGSSIVALFPRLTVLGDYRVEQPAWAASPLQQTPYNHVPVTVPVVARVREQES